MNKVEQFWQQLAHHDKPLQNQLQRYEAKNAPEYIKKFIAIGGGARMGTLMEQYARFSFSALQKRGKGKGQTGYDHLLSSDAVVYVEQK